LNATAQVMALLDGKGLGAGCGVHNTVAPAGNSAVGTSQLAFWAAAGPLFRQITVALMASPGAAVSGKPLISTDISACDGLLGVARAAPDMSAAAASAATKPKPHCRSKGFEGLSLANFKGPPDKTREEGMNDRVAAVKSALRGINFFFLRTGLMQNAPAPL
jgi:hypothetical protein